jgi:hypothetical protein
MATTLKGAGLLMVWADVPADKEEEFNRWYNEEHLQERLAVPGFLSGARYDRAGLSRHLGEDGRGLRTAPHPTLSPLGRGRFRAWRTRGRTSRAIRAV